MTFKPFALALTGALLIGQVASAAPVEPSFTRFGSLPAATFAGSGIPNDQVTISETNLGPGGTLVLGIAATPRFTAPDPTNDSAGTYTVQAGTSSDGRALWNFSWFADIINGDGSITDEDLDLTLFYDFDPAVDTDLADLGRLNIDNGLIGTVDGAWQGSQNLTFDYLATADPFDFVSLAPSGAATSFDPDVAGEYSFLITGRNNTRVAMNVNVAGTVAPIPLPATAILLLAGLGGLGAVRRRRG